MSTNNNFVTALVFLAITRANVRDITTSRDAAMRHLGLGQIPPDSARTPVTIYALARDLRTPYETVRRHVLKLKSMGVCVVTPEGVLVPAIVFAAAEKLRGAGDTEQSFRALVTETARFGIVAHGRFQPVAHDVTLQATRLTTNYFVDSVCTIASRLDLDVMSVLVLISLGLMNTESITRDATLAYRFGGLHGIPPDELRTPVAVYAIAKHLMLPYETTRRSTQRLAERGLVARNESGGLTVPSAAMEKPEMMAAFTEFAELTMEFLGDLAEYGVTAETLKDRPTLNEIAAAAERMATAS
jgi:DNA-binding transcriptional regulator YhcF (GntR family)